MRTPISWLFEDLGDGHLLPRFTVGCGGHVLRAGVPVDGRGVTWGGWPLVSRLGAHAELGVCGGRFVMDEHADP